MELPHPQRCYNLDEIDLYNKCPQCYKSHLGDRCEFVGEGPIPYCLCNEQGTPICPDCNKEMSRFYAGSICGFCCEYKINCGLIKLNTNERVMINGEINKSYIVNALDFGRDTYRLAICEECCNSSNPSVRYNFNYNPYINYCYCYNSGCRKMYLVHDEEIKDPGC